MPFCWASICFLFFQRCCGVSFGTCTAPYSSARDVCAFCTGYSFLFSSFQAKTARLYIGSVFPVFFHFSHLTRYNSTSSSILYMYCTAGSSPHFRQRWGLGIIAVHIRSDLPCTGCIPSHINPVVLMFWVFLCPANF